MSKSNPAPCENGKLPTKVKIGYALLGITPNLQMLFQMFFLVMFYVNVLQIGATTAGIVIMVARIWDFINDPLMGALLEKTKKPHKCIYWMSRAVPLIAIFMVLTYFVPNFNLGMRIVWAVVSYICLGMSATMYGVPNGSLRSRITTDRDERAKVNVYETFVSCALNVLVPMATMPVVAILQGYGITTAFAKMAAIYAVIMVIFSFIGIYFCKDYDKSEDDEEISSGKAKSPSVKEMFKALGQNKYALSIALLQAVKMLLSSIGSSVLVYFCTYVLGNVNIMSIESAISFIPGLIAVALLVFFFRKFGNAGTGVLGAAINIVLLAIMTVAYYLEGHHLNAILYLVCAVTMGFGNQLTASMTTQCLMDTLVYGEYKTGHKNTGVIMAASGLGQKIGLAFGSSIAAFVMGFVSFDPNAATQPVKVLNAFFHMTVTVQLFVTAVMLLVYLFLTKLEKKLPEYQKAIEERKAQQA